MNKTAKLSGPGRKIIAENRKAFHDYTLEERFEAGIVLEGWEVKSLRAGKIQITESYVLLKKGEAWVIGSHISPLLSASTHIKADPTRTRKLLLHKKERPERRISCAFFACFSHRKYRLVPPQGP